VWLPCPYLGRDVELTDERERHIRHTHGNLLPGRRSDLAATLADPDEVRVRTWRPGELIFVRAVHESELVVVVTIEGEPVNDADPPRAFVATAYVSENPPASAVVWVR
jgi:hypothetical protein